jgi:Zn-dependent peptidase ImmA (M78 family)
MRQDGIRDARRTARALVRRLGIAAPEHIRIEAIARRLGAIVIETKLDGADAQLVCRGERVEILVSDRITDPGARRFAIAHELGHFFLEHPCRPPYLLSQGSVSRRGREDARDYEAEANAFASELLIPKVLVDSWCAVSPVSLEVPWRIAHTFQMSILSSAIRFAELSPERCAAVFCARRQVAWVAPSATFTRAIPRGRRLDPQSVAWDFYEKGAVDDAPIAIPADAWFDTSAEVDIIEHATVSREHGTVLSMLWIPERVAAPLGMVA